MAKTSQVNRNESGNAWPNATRASGRVQVDRDGSHAAGGGSLRRDHEAGAVATQRRAVRVRLRCELTGRSRGNYRKFKLCRIALRDLASSGQIPGMVKASW